MLELENLQKLGFPTHLQSYISQNPNFQVARVIVEHKGSYIVKNHQFEIPVQVTGKLMYSAQSRLDYPAVGDWVLLQTYDDDSQGIIYELLPRQNTLKRKVSGQKVDYQIVGSNIDVAFIIQGLDKDLNLNRLERYLVMVQQCDIQPIVLLSKSDLLSSEELKQQKLKIQNVVGNTPLFSFSSLGEEGVKVVQELMESGKTYCLIGSSGVGKTTLLNKLIGEEAFETQAVRSDDSRGRHTTTKRQLLVLESGSIVIDTPGMRELGNIEASVGIEDTFDYILELAKQCKFKNCSHTNEPHCAVIEAIESGELDESRWLNFLKIQRETERMEMSYFEKRQFFRQQGKMYKQIQERKKNR